MTQTQTIVHHCPNCGKETTAGEHFCSNCGHDLSTNAQPGSPATVTSSMDHIPDSIKSFDDIAKQLVTMEGFLVTLYFGAFTLIKLSVQPGLTLIIYVLPIVFILFSLIAALRVFFPSGYLQLELPTGSHHITMIELARHKSRWFSVASVFFILGIAGVLIAFITYLLRPT
jgi:hypothetical protein